MKNLKYIILTTIVVLSLSKGSQCYAQYSAQQQNEIDSLNEILNNPKNHDTSIVQAYVGLAIIFTLIHFLIENKMKVLNFNKTI